MPLRRVVLPDFMPFAANAHVVTRPGFIGSRDQAGITAVTATNQQLVRLTVHLVGWPDCAPYRRVSLTHHGILRASRVAPLAGGYGCKMCRSLQRRPWLQLVRVWSRRCRCWHVPNVVRHPFHRRRDLWGVRCNDRVGLLRENIARESTRWICGSCGRPMDSRSG